jgi:signal transduction histidine kinase
MKHKGFNSYGQGRSWRRWRADRQAIIEFNRSLMLIADPDALMASISARIKEIFAPECVIILRATDAGIFTIAFSSGCDLEELKNIRLTHRDRLAKWLLTNETVLVVGRDRSLLTYLGTAECEMLDHLNVRACAPLLALNRLSGVMMLCSTKKDWELDQDHINLLNILANQSSIAFENAFLYQQQRDRLARLYRAERLAAAGQLAASVAHEIRNPLTIIRSTIQYLLGEFDAEHPKRELVEGVIAEVDRIDRTIDGLLSLARAPVSEPFRVALGQLIQETLLLVRSQANRQSVKILSSAPTEELFIMGDTSQLKQLFLNLMLNALQAMQTGGQLKIELRMNLEPPAPSSERLWAIVLLSDSGCGIPAENLDKIFDPFFTTKLGGTGLGLSTSYAITRHHGGEIEISSEGEGTSVTVRFPLVS